MINQRDVARLAGVSIRTVSNVVNDFTHVAPGTRARVQAALDELGYRPNLLARGLSSGRSGLVALILPMDVPYFHELAQQVVEAAEAHGLTVLIDSTDGKVDRERTLVGRRDRSTLFDGIIFSPIDLEESEVQAMTTGTPVVLLGEKPAGTSLDRVHVDDASAAEAATRHLVELGCQRIAAVGQPARGHSLTAGHRIRGYRRVLESSGHTFDPDLIGTVTRYHRADGAQAMATLLDRPHPLDAVFCFNDLLALGALRTLLSRGYRVPDDVALVGYDDIEDGRFSTPTLTTIAPDKQQIAALAVRLLTQRMAESGRKPQTRRADWRLIPRESTEGVSGGDPADDPGDDPG